MSDALGRGLPTFVRHELPSRASDERNQRLKASPDGRRFCLSFIDRPHISGVLSLFRASTLLDVVLFGPNRRLPLPAPGCANSFNIRPPSSYCVLFLHLVRSRSTLRSFGPGIAPRPGMPMAARSLFPYCTCCCDGCLFLSHFPHCPLHHVNQTSEITCTAPPAAYLHVFMLCKSVTRVIVSLTSQSTHSLPTTCIPPASSASAFCSNFRVGARIHSQSLQRSVDCGTVWDRKEMEPTLSTFGHRPATFAFWRNSSTIRYTSSDKYGNTFAGTPSVPTPVGLLEVEPATGLILQLLNTCASHGGRLELRVS